MLREKQIQRIQINHNTQKEIVCEINMSEQNFFLESNTLKNTVRTEERKKNYDKCKKIEDENHNTSSSRKRKRKIINENE